MDELELRDLLRVAYARRWYAIAVFLVCMAGVVLRRVSRRRGRVSQNRTREAPVPAGAAVAENPLGAAMAAHRAQSVEVLRSGDPSAIKGLYGDLGSLLETAVGQDIESIPVLSFAETAGVVLDLASSQTGRLLDAGCGPNPHVSVALGRDPERFVVGLDIGLGTVRLARAVAERSGSRFFGVVGDVEALPFRSGVFDGGVCDDTIEHLPDDHAGAAELARVLRPNGRMVIATPNRHSAETVRRKLHDLARGRRHPASHYYLVNSHLREYTWGSAETLIRPWFRIRRRASVGWPGTGRRRLATTLTRAGPLRRFSRMVVIEVEPRAAPVPASHPATSRPRDDTRS